MSHVLNPVSDKLPALAVAIGGGLAVALLAVLVQGLNFGFDRISLLSLAVPFAFGCVLTYVVSNLLRGNLRRLRQDLETEFEQRTRQLRQSEDRFRQYSESATEWFWETDAQGHFLFMSSRLYQVSGARPEDIIGTRREDIKGEPRDPDEARQWEYYQRCVEQRIPFANFRYRARVADGRELVVKTSGRPYFDDRGEFRGYRGSACDVSGLLSEELGQNYRQELIYNATAVLQDGFYLFDADDRLVFCNPRFKEIYHRMGDKLDVGTHYEEFFSAAVDKQMDFGSDEEKQAWVAARREGWQDEIGTPIDIRLRGGISIRLVEQQMPGGELVGLCSDVTESSRIQAELDEAQRLARIGSFRWDVEHDRLLSFSKGYARLFGMTKEQLEIPPVELYPEFIHPEDLDRVRAAYLRSDSSGEVTEVEYRYRTPHGKTGYLVERLAPSLWREGKVVEQIGTVQDVTDSRQKQEELENAERLGKFGSFSWDFKRHRLASCSAEFARIMGFSLDQLADLPDGHWASIHHPDDHERVMQYFENLDASTSLYEIEYRVQLPGGQVRHVVEHGEPVLEEGEIVELRGSLQDVTESRLIEVERDEAQRLARIGSFRWDVLRDLPTSFSAEIGNIYGRPLDQLLQMNDREFADLVIHPEDRERVLETYDRATERGENYSIEFRIIRPDGELRHVIERARVADRRDGKVFEYLGMLQDVTDEKLNERELEMAQGIAGVGSFRWNLEHNRMSSYSKAYLRIHDRSAEEMDALGLEGLIGQIIHPADRQRVRETFERSETHDEGYQIEYRIRRPDGVYRQVVERCETSVLRDGKPVEQLGTLQDITDLRGFERELEDAQRLARIGSFRWDVGQERLISCSREYLDILGQSREFMMSICQDQFETWVHADDLGRLLAAYERLDRTGENLEIEYRILRPDGELRNVIERIGVSVWVDGEPSEQIGTLQDITERRLFEHQLEEAQRIAGVGSFRYSLEQGRYLSVSPEFARIYGRLAEVLLSQDDAALIELTVHPDDRERVAACYAEADKTGDEYRIEFRLLRPDGEVRKIVEHAEPLKSHEGRVVEQIGTMQDVTEAKRLEAELEEAQRISNVGSYRTDFVNDTLLSFSPQLAMIYGLNADEIDPENPYMLEVVVPEDRERVDLTYQRARLSEAQEAGEVLFEIEYRILRADGEVRHILERVDVSRIDDGKVTEVIGTLQDVTDRKLVEFEKQKSDEMLEAAIENVPGGFLVVNHDGIIERFNRKFFDLYPKQQFFINEGLPFTRFLQYGVDMGVYQEALHDPEAWMEQRLEWYSSEITEFIEHMADARSIQIALRRLPNGRWVSMHVDVTELQRAREAAEQANEAKSEFLASMSHELRTPMHGILSFAELGLKRLDTLSQEKLRQYLENIQISGTRLLYLLNDLLDLSKLEAGKMRFDMAPINLFDLAKACVSEQQLRLRAKNLSCELDSPSQEMTCVCDRNRVTQVITNILANAIKFSPEGGEIRIAVECGKNGSRLRVSDEGIGIPEDELDQVFDKFYQSSGSRNQSGGTGLGLAICREIIDLHQGRIWAENNAGGGTSVLFEIPRQPLAG